MVTCACSAETFSARANQQISVQFLATIDDGAGGRSEDWGNDLTLWAVVEPLAGREIFVSAQQQVRVDSRMTIRYQASLANPRDAGKCRVKLDERVFDVKFIKNLHRDLKREGKDFQQLLCVEGEP